MIPKFRTWDSIEKKFVEHFFITDNGLICNMEKPTSGYNSLVPIEKSELILMQSTGLYDKNGKEIFEGDIVQFEDYYIESDLPYINMGIVEWSQGQFTITNRASVEMEDLLDGEFLDLTIIGNIYENPELLEEQNKE